MDTYQYCYWYNFSLCTKNLKNTRRGVKRFSSCFIVPFLRNVKLYCFLREEELLQLLWPGYAQSIAPVPPTDPIWHQLFQNASYVKTH